jgi:hypothetical protein
LDEDLSLPVPLHISDQYAYSKKQSIPSKLYQRHPELPAKIQPAKSTSRPNQSPYLPYGEQNDEAAYTRVHPYPTVAATHITAPEYTAYADQQANPWGTKPPRQHVRVDSDAYLAHLEGTFPSVASHRQGREQPLPKALTMAKWDQNVSSESLGLPGSLT